MFAAPNHLNTNLDEAEWIRQLQQGNDEAFLPLMERYQNAVYHLCYRMLGSPTEAEDATQETFIRAYKAIRRYDTSRKFSTWLLSIASHYCIDQLRKRRWLILSFDEMPYFDLADDHPGPEGAALMDERQRQVRQLLGVLSETDRAAIILRYWYDYSYDEIAEALDLSNSAVKSRLHRARLALAQAWNEQNNGGRAADLHPNLAREMSYAT